MQMFILNIGKNDNCHYRTIQDGLNAVPYDEPACLVLEPGVYEEKVFLEKRYVILQGAGQDKTVIRWHDGGKLPHADGRNTGTFRSYTLFAGGGRVELADLTVENAAGSGETAGQALALYADAAQLVAQRVTLRGRQDTLFLAPLPANERIAGGFYGPRAFTPRRLTCAGFDQCTIYGDVDFIFGGGDAVFRDCRIVSLDKGQPVNGYVTAPSGEGDGLGLVFDRCRFEGEGCATGTVFLGRPWRAAGRTTILNCQLGDHLHPALWDDWDNPQAHQERGFAVDDPAGFFVPNWTQVLTAEQANILTERAQRHWERLFDHTL